MGKIDKLFNITFDVEKSGNDVEHAIESLIGNLIFRKAAGIAPFILDTGEITGVSDKNIFFTFTRPRHVPSGFQSELVFIGDDDLKELHKNTIEELGAKSLGIGKRKHHKAEISYHGEKIKIIIGYIDNIEMLRME